MAKLSELDRQIIRWAPPGSGFRLAQLFGVSVRYILQLQSGKRGLPLGNGLGARPWKLRDRDLVMEWHQRRVGQADAARDRALKEINEGEALNGLPGQRAPAGLYRGMQAGRRRSVPCAPAETGRQPALESLIREGWLFEKPSGRR